MSTTINLVSFCSGHVALRRGGPSGEVSRAIQAWGGGYGAIHAVKGVRKKSKADKGEAVVGVSQAVDLLRKLL